MRFAIALAALAAAAVLSPSSAKAEGWCYDGEQGQTCGFVSLQQCLDALSANAVGTCLFNPANTTYEVIRSPARKKTAN